MSLKARNKADGILPVNKPKGMSSKDVSRKIEGQFGRYKIGHVGTLDPEASGVLVLVFGKYTKLQDNLLALPKRYTFEIQFGIKTSTGDRTGEVLEESSVPAFSREQLEKVYKQFEGWVEQVPPLHSAVKFEGKELYKYARKGQGAAVPLHNLKRKVFIHHIEIVEIPEPDRVVLDVICSKGTYIRSLCEDIAAPLNTVGTMNSIMRTEACGFVLEACYELDDILASSTIEEKLLESTDIEGQFPTMCIDDFHQLNLLKKQRFLKGDLKMFENRIVAPHSQGVEKPYASLDQLPVLLTDEFENRLGIAKIMCQSKTQFCLELISGI